MDNIEEKVRHIRLIAKFCKDIGLEIESGMNQTRLNVYIDILRDKYIVADLDNNIKFDLSDSLRVMQELENQNLRVMPLKVHTDLVGRELKDG